MRIGSSLRKAVSEYRDALSETLAVSRWVTIEMMTPELRSWWFKFLMWLALTIVVGALMPLVIGAVITEVTRSDYIAALYIAGAIFALSVVQEFFRRNSDQAREWLWGIGMRLLEDRISRLLFEKSVGQHIQEGSRLTVGNIERGQSAAFVLRELWLMELIPELLILTSYPIALLIAFPLGGAIMSVAVIVHLTWSVILNRHLVEKGDAVDEWARRTRRYQRDRWDKSERVKTSGAVERELARLDRESNGWLTLDRSLWVNAINWFMLRGFVMHAGASLTMVVAVLMVASGQESVGILYTAFALAYAIKSELDHLSGTTRSIMRNVPSVKSLRETLLMPPDITDTVRTCSPPREESICLSFEKVGHGFSNGESKMTPILQDVSFRIDAKGKTALIGPSGAGKTTLMRLALRYMDPDQGRILVNGSDLRDVRLVEWMRSVGYIPQHAQIFDGTIGDNLRYGLEDPESLSNEEVWDMVRRLQIDFGERLTHGLDTVVGRNGLKLSGGQAQRVMIGAAALKRPQFMIIDEATSSLDATTERLVHDGLKEVLGNGVGALIVTHRLSTVRDLCDSFVILRPLEEVGSGENQVEAVSGSFEELFQSSPTFRKLAADQGILH